MQSRTLAEAYSENRDKNHFNILRVFAALFVIVSHSYLFITARSYYLHDFSLGAIGVDIFFIISGFLVTGSYLYRGNPNAYLWARFLRIWPALMVNAVILAFIMGPLVTTSPLNSKFFMEALKYVYSNFLLMYPGRRGLLGVFNNLEYPVLNGVLWTLNYEVIMYCVIGLLGILGILVSSRHMSKFFVGYGAVYLIAVLLISSDSDLFVSLLRFTSAFFVGMALQVYKEKIKLIHWIALLALLAFALFLYLPFKQIYYLPMHICMAYGVIYFAFLPMKFMEYYNRLGDYSYGLYIYGWPVGRVLQTVYSSPMILILATTGISLIIAAASWHLLERKALNLKNLHREGGGQYKEKSTLCYSLLCYSFL